MMDAEAIQNMVSGLVNIITALCALIAIRVTVSENLKLREQTNSMEVQRFRSSRFEILCFDKIVLSWDELYDSIKDNLCKMKDCPNTNTIKECYGYMVEELQRFEVRLRYLKLFDQKLYKECASEGEKAQDILANYINEIGASDSNMLRGSRIKRVLIGVEERGVEIVKKLYEYEKNEIWKE